MHCAVLVFPGSNCDIDLYKAVLQLKGATAEYVWHTSTDLDRFDVILIPGGFTYGDYLRPGALAGVSPVISSVKKAAKAGKLILGICNGFQILIEAGLLPGALLPNHSLQFICDVVPVKVAQSESPFTSRYQLGDILRLPIAHGSGNYHCDVVTQRKLQVNGQIAFCFPPQNNPNGSAGGITGLLNEQRNVLGMMPHPERAVKQWLGSTDGFGLFESMLENHTALLNV
jgi:phosphoribosylformylglycinamidine synthase